MFVFSKQTYSCVAHCWVNEGLSLLRKKPPVVRLANCYFQQVTWSYFFKKQVHVTLSSRYVTVQQIKFMATHTFFLWVGELSIG